jgi:hypothetical protein
MILKLEVHLLMLIGKHNKIIFNGIIKNFHIHKLLYKHSIQKVSDYF